MTLTRPSTGQDWSLSNTTIWRKGRVRRGGLVVVFARDYNGINTNISPTVFNPLSQDNKLRQDLTALIIDPANTGALISSPVTPNLGWYPLGLLDPKGVDVMPNLTVDKLEALQTLSTVRTDLQKKEKTVSFTAFESTEIIDLLEYNLPFSEYGDEGDPLYSIGEQVDAQLVPRQLLLVRADAVNGQIEYTVQGFGNVSLEKINKRTWDKKNADSFDVSFSVDVDPYLTDKKGRPATDIKWRGGQAWINAVGSPEWGVTVPTATAASGGHATVTATEPGSEDPAVVTYTVTQQVGGTGGYTAATITVGDPTGIGTGTLVFHVTGLTATSTYKFEVLATDPNGIASTSGPTASITALA